MHNTVKRWIFLPVMALVLSGCVYQFPLFPKLEPFQEEVIGGKGADKVLLLDISGFISEEPVGGLIKMPDMVSRVKEELSRAARDDKVKAVVLRINSPGGTITASDLIYHEVQRFKTLTGKPVFSSILDLGASGAYYIAMASDQVVAHPTSVIGSIGVIMLHVNFQGLMEKFGVGAESIKSGINKDLGSPVKPLSTEGRGILQGIIDDMYGRFLQVIAGQRKHLTKDQIKTLADGRVYTASQAKENGLIDEIAYLEDVIEMSKASAGIREAQVILYKRPGEYKNNIYSRNFSGGIDPLAAWGLETKQLFRGTSPHFLYLWMP